MVQIPTNPMYDIDENGVVRLISKNTIVPEYVNHRGRRAVKIRGRSHKLTSTPLDRLMLLTYKPLPFDKDPDWMSVKFVNGNRNNIDLINLEWDDTWYYPNPQLGIEFGVTGWIEAYGHPRLHLRLDRGQVLIRCSRTYKEIGPTIHDGYQILNVSWQERYLRFHRLIALTFLPHPLDTDHLTVNHLDSNKDNNDPKNLEWATYTQNNFHSYSEGPRGDLVRKIRVRNIETGRETVVAGYNEMGRFLGVLPQAAYSVMERRKFEGRPYKGHVAKYEDDQRTWDELSRSDIRENMKDPGAIARKNLDTGEVIVYSSAQQLNSVEEMDTWVIFRLLNSKYMIPWKRKCFQVYTENEILKWPNYPNSLIDVYEKTYSSDRPIEVTDKEGNSLYYASVTDWCMQDRENRCDPAVLSRYMKTNGSHPLQWRDWVFSHIDLSQYKLE